MPSSRLALFSRVTAQNSPICDVDEAFACSKWDAASPLNLETKTLRSSFFERRQEVTFWKEDISLDNIAMGGSMATVSTISRTAETG